MSIGMPEILVVAVILLLVFGSKKIPEFLRGLSSGVKEFKESSKDEKKSKDDDEE